MAITRAQAGRAYDIMAEVIPNYGTWEGRPGVITDARMTSPEDWMVEVTFNGTITAWYKPDGLDPGATLRLISIREHLDDICERCGKCERNACELHELCYCN